MNINELGGEGKQTV